MLTMHKPAATRPEPTKGELTVLTEAQLDAVSGGLKTQPPPDWKPVR